MKTLRLTTVAVASAMIVLAACQQSSKGDLTPPPGEEAVSLAGKKPAPGNCNPTAYMVTLESRTEVNGNWEWIWSVQNPNPGNGDNGTLQDLSHWGMELGFCTGLSNITEAAYSADGVNWVGFAPSYQTDPSQGCMTTPVLKFDFGTTGANKSYYKLVLNVSLTAGTSYGYYKGGSGCCTFNFFGIGCPGGEEERVE